MNDSIKHPGVSQPTPPAKSEKTTIQPGQVIGEHSAPSPVPIQSVSEMPASVAGQPIYLIRDTDWVLNGITTINLLIVILFYFLAVRDRRRERNEDDRVRRDQAQREITNFWIQDLISRPHIDVMESYFELAEKQIKDRSAMSPSDTVQLHSLARTSIATFKAKHHELNYKVVQPLNFIHPSFIDMAKIMDELEDFVTGELEKIPGLPASGSPTAVPPEVKLQDLRRRFLQAFNNAQRTSLGLTGR